MSQRMTTVGGFTVEDVTFRGARKQSEIEKELGIDEVKKEDLEVPVSLTPEQVTDYYKRMIDNTEDTHTKVLYAQTIKWIKDLHKVKAELTLYKLRELREQNARDDSPDDIE